MLESTATSVLISASGPYILTDLVVLLKTLPMSIKLGQTAFPHLGDTASQLKLAEYPAENVQLGSTSRHFSSLF
jgi:hypothetical protein